MFDQQDIERAAFEEVLRQMPAAVIVVEARSGEKVRTDRGISRRNGDLARMMKRQ